MSDPWPQQQSDNEAFVEKRPLRMSLVLALTTILFAAVVAMSPPADAQTVNGPQCQEGVRDGDQCRIESAPVMLPSECPPDTDVVGEPGSCVRIVDPVPGPCPAPGTGSGNCTRPVDRAVAYVCAPGFELLADGISCTMLYDPIDAPGCPEGTPGSIGDDPRCVIFVRAAMDSCPAGASGEAPDCYVEVLVSCPPGAVEPAAGGCYVAIAPVTGDAECAPGFDERGTSCLGLSREYPEIACPAHIAYVNEQNECVVAQYPLNPGGPTCPAMTGVHGTSVSPLVCVQRLNYPCPADAPLRIDGQCGQLVAPIRDECDDGLRRVGDDCSRFDPLGVIPGCSGSDQIVGGQCQNLVAATDEYVCPVGGAVFETDDGQCLESFTVAPVCPPGTTLYDGGPECGEPVADLGGGLRCPADFDLLEDVCVRYVPLVVLCLGRAVTINMAAGDSGVGTSGSDVFLGTNGDDVINGRGGNDYICGEGGHDLIRGGRGDDWVLGGAGDDDIRGGAGNDLLAGVDGHDVIRGEAGDDILAGNDGDDLLKGGKGDDLLQGDGGTDVCAGNAGTDTDRNGTCEKLRTIEILFTP